jgi:hypothetical protein
MVLLFPMKPPCFSVTLQKNNADDVGQLIFWSKGPTPIGKAGVSVIEGPNKYVHGSMPSVAIAGHVSREKGELCHDVNWLGGV